ncbi:unnamed protein product [Brachionus calyciflorus]|uniref:Reverse transcriptase domain-containing protein n=1 Tax=Brachionus calyciflorus TaxID=104777 RepID=A0A813YY27_9BILA|nr:unnamed protein product [Brachionus calyciflorus]
MLNEKSNEFKIDEDAKQGGKLSAFLFNLYVNDLIENWTEGGLGASINGINLSDIAYCDDIIILSPVARHAQILLDKIGEYSAK